MYAFFFVFFGVAVVVVDFFFAFLFFLIYMHKKQNTKYCHLKPDFSFFLIIIVHSFFVFCVCSFILFGVFFVSRLFVGL